ncbi:MAG: tetratricopeptide repeat protein, partial [Treponema sp.]|nr:tetratricopeptide repeat protein [Treponema sp.]
SRSGRPNEALQALLRSMELDRRVENSWGLASSWRASGDVHRRTGNFPAARAAYLRAAEIFAALDNEQALQDVRDRLAALPEGSSS